MSATGSRRLHPRLTTTQAAAECSFIGTSLLAPGGTISDHEFATVDVTRWR